MKAIDSKIYEEFGKFITKLSNKYNKSEEDCAKVISIYIASNYNVLTIID